jgi:excisionase family DNA binding protein
MQRILHPRPDAAFKLGISVIKVDQMVSDGTVQAVKIGKRVLIPETELVRIGKHGAALEPTAGTGGSKGGTK